MTPDISELHNAIKHGDVIAVRRFLDGGGLVGARDVHGRSPLSMAATEGDTAIIRELLDRGADVNERWPGYDTPLVLAAMSGSLPAVELLLARGAKTDADGVPVPELLNRLGYGHEGKIIIAIELARLSSGLTSA